MKKKDELKKIRKVFLDKVEVLAVLLFIFALFLLDVNLNQIAAFGLDKTQTVFGSVKVYSSSMFWFGFIVMTLCLLIVSIRSFYRKHNAKFFDYSFVILGIIGWGIILSGGLLIFFGGDDAIIPFFSFLIERINYYHFGIGLEILTIIYFALTK